MKDLFVCIEFWGNGDPFFGGQADDRSLMVDGAFCVPPRQGVRPYRPALFTSRELATEHGALALNRRDKGLISGCPAGDFDRRDGEVIA